MELSEAQIAGLQNEGRAYCDRLGHERIGEGAEAFVAGYRRALEHLAAQAAKKQQQDHQAQPFGVRTEPGEENARGVVVPVASPDLREAAKQFYNLTLADPEVIIRPPNAVKQEAITKAGQCLRIALTAGVNTPDGEQA